MTLLSFVIGEPVPWPDLKGKPVGDVASMAISTFDKGMASGRPSVAIRFDLPDGRTYIGETSARLFCTAARMIMARYPDLFEDP